MNTILTQLWIIKIKTDEWGASFILSLLVNALNYLVVDILAVDHRYIVKALIDNPLEKSTCQT